MVCTGPWGSCVGGQWGADREEWTTGEGLSRTQHCSPFSGETFLGDPRRKEEEGDQCKCEWWQEETSPTSPRSPAAVRAVHRCGDPRTTLDRTLYPTLFPAYLKTMSWTPAAALITHCRGSPGPLASPCYPPAFFYVCTTLQPPSSSSTGNPAVPSEEGAAPWICL